MNLRKTLLAGAALLALLAGDVAAQQATLVSPTATTNAAVSLYGPVGGTTSCNTVNTTSANNAVTITPAGNQFVYVTGVYIDITANTTGTTQVATSAFGTNMPGGAVYSLATVVPTAGENGTFRQIAEVYNPPLKSNQAGAAVSLTPSAAAGAGTIVCQRVAAYMAQ